MPGIRTRGTQYEAALFALVTNLIPPIFSFAGGGKKAIIAVAILLYTFFGGQAGQNFSWRRKRL